MGCYSFVVLNDLELYIDSGVVLNGIPTAGLALVLRFHTCIKTHTHQVGMDIPAGMSAG